MELEVSLTTGDKFEPHIIAKTNPTFDMVQLIMVMSAVVIAILLYGMIIKFILKRPPPKRPIDTLNLWSLSIQAGSYFISAFLIVSVLWTNKSIKDNFGQLGCVALFIAQPLFMWSRLLGSLGLTFFRYIFMARSDVVKRHGIKKLTTIIWSFQALAIIHPIFIFVIGSLYKQSTFAITVCEGIPTELQKTILEHSESESQGFKTVIQLFAIPKVILVALDIALNLKLYKLSREATTKMKSSLSANSVTRRYKKNAINLQGQLVGFVFNLAFEVVTFMAIIFRTDIGLEGFHVYGLGFISIAFVNMGTLMASPELRREYLGADDKLIPWT